MELKTIALKPEAYIKLRQSMLDEYKANGESYTISGYIEMLLDEHNKHKPK